MNFKIEEDGLLFAHTVGSTSNARDQFLNILKAQKSFFEEVLKSRKFYTDHIQRDYAGGVLRPEKLGIVGDEFMTCAAFVFAGLYFAGNYKIPLISSDTIEEMRHECDEERVVLGRHGLLGSFGDLNEIWVADFIKLARANELTRKGMGLIYALAVAWITTVRNAELHAELSAQVAMGTEALRATGVLDELEGLVGDFGSGQSQ